MTGRAQYGADINLPGTLHGKILRSPHGHARIVSIDTSKAEALPDVKAVVTAADVPIVQDMMIDFGETMGNARLLAENCLAQEKTLYKGHAVAAVAASNPHVAEEALSLIEVEYEPLPVVLNAIEAMREDAPLLHEAMTTRSIAERFTRGDDTGVHSNIASHLQFKRGDIEEGFARADVVVEREFTTSTVHQGYIEPHTSTARWAPMATSPSGPARRAPSASAARLPPSSACPRARSRSSPWRSAAASAPRPTSMSIPWRRSSRSRAASP